MTEPSETESAQRTQRDADDMGTTEVDEKAKKEHFDRTGEPDRDSLGNQEGAS
jgi:hypothetical protein